MRFNSICRTWASATALALWVTSPAQTLSTTRASVSSSGSEAHRAGSWAAAISGNGKYLFFNSHAGNFVANDDNGSDDVFRKDLATGEIKAVSSDAKGHVLPNGSYDAYSSYDGRYVVFYNNNQFVLRPTSTTWTVYRKDMQTGELLPISGSADNSLANDGSWQASISDDGNVIAYASFSPDVVPGDTNGVGDIFVYEVKQKKRTRVSVSSSGAQGNGESFMPMISGNGNVVVFASWASNLVANDTNKIYDTFTYDRTTKQTRRVSVSSSGAQTARYSLAGCISYDGRFVAMDTRVVPYGSGQQGIIRLWDAQTGTTSQVSLLSSGAGAAESFEPSISPSGRYVAYGSWDSRIVEGDTNGQYDTYIYDRRSGVTKRVSVSPKGVQTNAGSYMFYMNRQQVDDNGNVVFDSPDTALDPTDTNLDADTFYYKASTGGATRYSIVSPGPEKGGAANFVPHASADGRFITFTSMALNLTSETMLDFPNVFLRDTLTNKTTLVSAGSPGLGANGMSYVGSVSNDGNLVVFSSTASSLVANDTNNAQDIFLRDVAKGTTTLLSRRSDGVIANSYSFAPSISADGRYVAFESGATNLVTGVSAPRRHIYRLDRTNGNILLCDFASGNVASNADAWQASISANGRYVCFTSNSSDLVAGDTNKADDVFVFDADTNTVIRASVGNDGKQAMASCQWGTISGDGTSVAFTSAADGLVEKDTNKAEDVFVRNLAKKTTSLASVNEKGVQATRADGGSISYNGRFVTFNSDSDGLLPVAVNGMRQVYRKDLLTGGLLRVSQSSTGSPSNNSSAWMYPNLCPVSADGSVVSYASLGSNLVANDTSYGSDIFVAKITDRKIQSIAASMNPAYSGETTVLTVTLNQAAAAGGSVVTLKSSAAGLTVPASLTIAAGQTKGTVNATVGNLASAQAFTVTATVEGRSATLGVTGQVWIKSLALSPTQVVGGKTSSLTINLGKAAPAQGLTVALKSSDSSVTLPASVKIAAGATTVSVTATSTKVSAKKTVTLTASVLGQSATTSMVVNP